jgi:hypothetical protein
VYSVTGDQRSGGSPGTPIVAARYRIAEYDSWLAGFAAHDDRRVLAGAVGHAISVSLDDPRRVEVIVEFSSLEAARRYEEHLLLASTRDGDRRDGVVEHGAVWVAVRAERRVYRM